MGEKFDVNDDCWKAEDSAMFFISYYTPVFTVGLASKQATRIGLSFLLFPPPCPSVLYFILSQSGPPVFLSMISCSDVQYSISYT